MIVVIGVDVFGVGVVVMRLDDMKIFCVLV